MKMYKDFYSRKFFESDSIKFGQHEFESFSEALKLCQVTFGSNPSFQSYTSAAQNQNLDPEKDFQFVDDFMSKQGWNLEKVKKLSEDIDNFSYNCEFASVSSCAAVDYYLYKITKSQFPLSGWHEPFPRQDIYEVDNSNEYVIRFDYGWHKSEYGKLIILQSIGSINRFIDGAKKSFIPEIFYRICYDLDLRFFHSFEGKYVFTERNREKQNQEYFSFIDEHINNYIWSDYDYSIEIDTLELLKFIAKIYKEKQDFCNIQVPFYKIIKSPTDNPEDIQNAFDKLVSDRFNYGDFTARIIVSGHVRIIIKS